MIIITMVAWPTVQNVCALDRRCETRSGHDFLHIFLYRPTVTDRQKDTQEDSEKKQEEEKTGETNTERRKLQIATL